jgi:hypothetical protein
MKYIHQVKKYCEREIVWVCTDEYDAREEWDTNTIKGKWSIFLQWGPGISVTQVCFKDRIGTVDSHGWLYTEITKERFKTMKKEFAFLSNL